MRFASRSLIFIPVGNKRSLSQSSFSTLSSNLFPERCIPSLSVPPYRTSRHSKMWKSTLLPSSSLMVVENRNLAHAIHDNVKQTRNMATSKRSSSKLKAPPRKAAVNLTPTSRSFFKRLLSQKLSNTSTSDSAGKNIAGIMLNYQQSLSGQPRMVFSFEFVHEDDLDENDEGVSLEVLSDGVTPKSPSESFNDNLPKLYVHHHAFMKVLGATVDLKEDGFTPFLIDREGNEMDPNNT